MPDRYEDILNKISKMNIMEIVELTKLAEEKFNITKDSIITNISKKEENKKEKIKEIKTNFTVIMTDYGKSKINVIKIIRKILNLGLKEAKDFVEDLPATIKENIEKTNADEIKCELEKIGASVELK